MKIGRYILMVAAMANSILLSAQVLRNEGNECISGGYLVVSGNYQNESSGDITLDGTITVSGNWTNNGTNNIIATPGTNGEVIFNGAGVQIIGGSGNEFDFENLTINSGSKTQVTAGKGVTVYGTATFADTLILKSTTDVFKPLIATFINKGTVSGNITMELFYKSTGSSTAGTGRGFYFSSPISNATSTILNVPTNVLFYQNEVARQYVKIITSGIDLTVAKGYIFRSATDSLLKFTGTPNAASSYSTPSIPRNDNAHYYLLGNPYPAVINWDDIDKTDNISSTIWYRSCDINGHMVTADTWNSALQEGTNNNGTAAVDGKIPPMQSVWVQCSSDGSGSLSIPNTLRSHSWGNANFFKSKAKNSKNILRLYLYSNDYRDETIIAQSESALNGFDDLDSRKFYLSDPNIAELYTLSSEKYNLVIQSVKPITNDSIVHVGIKVGTEGNYKFLANLSQASSAHNIILEDKLLHIKQDLFSNPEYAFHSLIINDTTRFVIHFLKAPIVKINTPKAVCTPSTVDLTSKAITDGSATGLTFTYWLDNKATVPYTSPANAEAGTYYIKGTATNGTYTISPIEATINPTPSVITTNPTPVNAPETVDLTKPEITLGSTEGLSFSYWLDINATLPYSTPNEALQGNYYIMGIVESSGCFSIAGPVSVIINANTTDVTPNISNETKIYSNENRIHLLNFEQNSLVSIYDILGNLQYSGKVKSNNDIIYCNFISGLYIVKISNSKEVKSKKVYIR